jgi:putative phosphoesterase
VLNEPRPKVQRRAMSNTRIGLIADTHDEIVDWDAIHPRVVDALGQVDLIIHCGDLTSTKVLDRLSQIAPVVAVRSANDPPSDGSRLLDSPRVIEHAGLTIGIINALPDHSAVEQLFGQQVDVVAHGGTHEASVVRDGRTLYVNPGSPSLADETSVAIVESSDGIADATILVI